MDWDKLKIFYAVAEAGNFTKATYILNLSQSAISRQIQSLEQELKTQLFERHARGLSLVVNILDPDVIVLGGGMSNIYYIYENINNQLQNSLILLLQLEHNYHLNLYL